MAIETIIMSVRRGSWTNGRFNDIRVYCEGCDGLLTLHAGNSLKVQVDRLTVRITEGCMGGDGYIRYGKKKACEGTNNHSPDSE